MSGDKRFTTELIKASDELGLVFGFAIVCTERGEEYVDLQGEAITPRAALKAAADFMLNSRASLTNHAGETTGDVVFCWPLLDDVVKALDITTPRTGILVAIRPRDPSLLDRVRSGEITGMSIGGLVREYEDA